ncbi:MAG TPA: ferrous iron transport protein B [Thermoanaerobaculia bacterium]|nr:ferrous iron transport protein B [Thermoanaerobaculia bacterium]
MTAEPVLTGTPHIPSAAPARLILVGNPNVGKSVLFSALTGRYVTVSNYPGTTVEITRAAATLGGATVEVLDTPGTNTLVPQSEDERVTRDILLAEEGAAVLQVGDLKNLRRTLLLTLQLVEHGVPMALCLNMSDEALDLGIEVDTERLAEIVGLEVVPTSALRRWNLDRLREAAASPRQASWEIHYSPAIEHGVARLSRHLPDIPARRALALSILAGDETLREWLAANLTADAIATIETIRQEIQESTREVLGLRIQRERFAHVDRAIAEVYRAPETRIDGFRTWLGSITMHPFWGVPFLFAVLFIAWLFVGKWAAGDVVDWFENTLFNGWINPWVIRGLDLIAPFPHVHAIEEGALTTGYALTGAVGGGAAVARFFHDLLVGEFGVFTMALTYAIAIVLPVVTTFFIFFGILEDSGYLPRLAVMLNRIFRAMGLNGKAVLPMVLGLGCDTMATLTTRVLETKKERIIVTLLLALGVPCSAQLGVILAMLGPLTLWATGVWLGAIGFSIFLVGWLSSKLVKGEAAEFLLEVPPIRTPKLSNIIIKVLARTEWYLKEAVPLFVIGTLLLYIAHVTHVLPLLQRALAPLVVDMLRLPAEAANAFLIGFLRRDYGAAGLFMLERDGILSPLQTVVSLTVVTLFIPCIANFFMMIKERGLKTATWMAVFVLVYSFGMGWALSRVLPLIPISLG